MFRLQQESNIIAAMQPFQPADVGGWSKEHLEESYGSAGVEVAAHPGKASVLSLKAYALAITPDNRPAGWTG